MGSCPVPCGLVAGVGWLAHPGLWLSLRDTHEACFVAAQCGSMQLRVGALRRRSVRLVSVFPHLAVWVSDLPFPPLQRVVTIRMARDGPGGRGCVPGLGGA